MLWSIKDGKLLCDRTVASLSYSYTCSSYLLTISAAIMSENALGCAAIEKFLQILQIVIQQPGSTFKSLMPNILNLSVDEIYPIVAQRPSPLVKGKMDCLYISMLLY